MPHPVPPLMRELLSWLADRRRSYAETMDAWRSHCPRHTVWEDALAEGLIQFEEDGPASTAVVLTPRGWALLDGYHEDLQ